MSEHEFSVHVQANLLTPEGYTRLRAELEELTTVKRAEIAERLRDSMDHGEFSEDNNELDEVKFEQAMVETRISDLKLLFANSHVLEPENLGTSFAGVGNYVTVEDAERGGQFEVRLVSSIEADPDQDLVSIESPMGMALLGAKVGDTVTFEAPAGKIRYDVKGIRA